MANHELFHSIYELVPVAYRITFLASILQAESSFTYSPFSLGKKVKEDCSQGKGSLNVILS